MKCPMCLGKGYTTDEDIKEYPHRCPNCDGKGFYNVDWQKVRCEVCNGSGKKPMTNEEYIRTCSTAELVHVIHLMTSSCYVCGSDGVDYRRCYFRKECTGEADIEDWLKAVRKE